MCEGQSKGCCLARTLKSLTADDLAEEMVITEKWRDKEEAKMYLDKACDEFFYTKNDLLYKINI